MALTISAVTENTPLSKTFTLSVPEGDPINVDTTLTFTGGGMTVLRGTPRVIFIQNTTVDTTVATGAATISIYSPTAAGFHVQKTSVAAGAVTQTYLITMLCKQPYEV